MMKLFLSIAFFVAAVIFFNIPALEGTKFQKGTPPLASASVNK